jgi:hypothetical protein
LLKPYNADLIPKKYLKFHNRSNLRSKDFIQKIYRKMVDCNSKIHLYLFHFDAIEFIPSDSNMTSLLSNFTNNFSPKGWFQWNRKDH